MKLFKKLILFTLALLSLSATSFYFYIKTLPTAPPDFININELDKQQAAKKFQCAAQQEFEYAYQVNISIESVLNNKSIYQSNIQFKSQLKQANNAIIQGIASMISIDEGQGPSAIKDVFFISRVQAQPYALFTAFNDLGLVDKHPMKVLAQFYKAISVGNSGENYNFAYDSMQRTYQYHHKDNHISRTAQATTANGQKLAHTVQGFNINGAGNNWRISLDNDCMPKTLFSQERQGIAAAGHSGFIKFIIQANKIPLFTDLSKIKLHSLSNSGNQWQAHEIASSIFEKKIESEEEMWQVFNAFNKDKNSAKLIKAAEFLIENTLPSELAQALLDQQLSNTAKRDLAFALSLSGHEDAEMFIIDTLQALPSNAGNDADLQKVRLMVSLSGSSEVSSAGYDTLATIAEDPSENENIKNNALINMGSTITQLENQGEDTSSLSDQLTTTLNESLQSDANSSSAILSAGNANIDTLNDEILTKLSSSNSKERYAAAMVLSRNSDYTDNMIEHLAHESSDLVSNAILANLDKASLSQQQASELEDIALTASPDLAKVIQQLLN